MIHIKKTLRYEYNYSFNTFRCLAQHSQPLSKHNTATHHTRCSQTVTRSATATAALTLHGVKWNSHRALQTNGLPVKISAIEYEAARCESTADRNVIAYYAECCTRSSSFQNYSIILLYFTKSSTHYTNLFHCARYPKFHGWLHAKPRTSPSTYQLYWPRAAAFSFGFVLPDSPIKSMHAFLSFLMQATCPSYLNVFDWIVRIFARGTKHAMFSNVLSLPLPCVHFVQHKFHIAWRGTEPDWN